MAHRGGSDVAPENSVAAFRHAVSLGYVYLETDVHLTADLVLVAFHDDDLSRLAGRPSRIRDVTWAELQEIDLGGGERIPRLADLLKEFPTSRFTIDPKSDEAVDPLIRIVADSDAVERVCIGSFDGMRTRRARKALGPTLCTSPDRNGLLKLLVASFVYPRWKHPYGCVQMPTSIHGIPLDGAWLVRRFQRLGLQVQYWTINDEPVMTRLLDNGADALITDTVALAKSVLDQRRAS